jgi:hypothetical protein
MTLTLEIDERLAKRLREVAKLTKTPMSELLDNLLWQHFTNEYVRNIRARTMVERRPRCPNKTPR